MSDSLPQPGPGLEAGAHSPPLVPDHELLRRVGAGSYGEVWLARNALGTLRAIKVVYRRHFEDEHPFEREFRGIQQFEPISRSHEGLVDILQVGRNEEAGYFYYVMELADSVDGPLRAAARSQSDESARSPDSPRPLNRGPLDANPLIAGYTPRTLRSDLQRRRRLPVADCVRLGLSLADALAHLHDHGLVHRDIKPSNIIFVGGVPKLADIGLVALADEAHSLVGTIGFIPPEGSGTPRADLFSLGRVLYEISTGRDRQEFPQLPAKLRDLADAEPLVELNEVVLKACENDPRRRYGSAAELRADLALLQGGRSVRRLRVAERRLVLATRAGLALAGLLVVAGGFYLAARRQAETNARLASTNAALAAANATLATDRARQLYVADMNLAMQAWDNGDVGPARVLLEKHRQWQPELCGFAWRLLDQFCQESDAAVTFHGHEGLVWGVTFVGDRGRVATVGADGTARLWDVGTGLLEQEIFRGKGQLHAVASSPDGRWLAFGGRDNRVHLWTVGTSNFVKWKGHTDAIRSLAFAPDGQWLASGGEDHVIRRWDLPGGAPRSGFTNQFSIEALTVAPGPRPMIAVGGALPPRLFDLNTGQHRDLPAHKSMALAIAFSPDGRWLASAGYDGVVRLWDRQRDEALDLGGSAPIRCLAFSPDSRWLAEAGSDRVIRLWDVRSRQRVRSLRGHSEAVYALAFSPDGRWLASGSADGTAKVWNVAPAAHGSHILQHESVVSDVAFSRDGRRLASATAYEERIRIWNTATERSVDEIQGEARALWCLAWLPDGRRLISGGTDGSLRLWDTASRTNLATRLRAHRQAIDTIVVSPDGQTVATGARDGLVRLWAVESSGLREISTLPGGSAAIRVVSFSPDGRHLAASGRDGRLLWWPLASPGAPRVLGRHGTEVRGLAFSPDGRWLVSGGADRTVSLFNLATQREEALLPAHEAEISALAFSPDGRTLASASWDSTVKLWNFELRQSVATLRGHSGQVTSLAFSPDGATLATAGADGTVRLWKAGAIKDTGR